MNKEQFNKNLKELEAAAAMHPKGQDDLIEILHKTQELFGYIPQEAIEIISSVMQVPRSIIFGVITFYHFFTMSPPSKYTVKVCLGTACFVKGANDILEELKEQLNVDIDEVTEDGLFKIQGTRCLGACGLAPVIMIEDDVYGRLTRDKIKGILEKYKQKETKTVNA